MQGLAGAPPPTRRAASVDLRGVMLEVVADKTGYPAEMLDLSMSLEDDLGIDSIKRVEILSAVQDQAPGIPDVDAAHLATLATLGDIVDYMRSLSGEAAPAPAPSVDLHAIMLEVVADKTGYPAEMLDLAMSLEDDLGIDSIKRVEILSAVQDQAPGLPDVDAGHLATLTTLGAIVDYMGGLSGPKTEATDNEAPDAPAPPALGRYVLRTIESPPLGFAQAGLWGATDLVVTDDGAGVAPALVAALGERGIEARVVTDVPDTADAVVFTGGLRGLETREAAVAVNREAFRAARTVAPRFATVGGLFVTVMDTGGRFAPEDTDPLRAWLAGLPALTKTAAQEWPKASLKAIDLQRGERDAETLAAALADELLTGGPDPEVGLTANGVRRVTRSVAAEVERGEAVIARGDVVLVSGGARGVTAASVLAWAKETQARHVLLGRTPLSPEPACCAGLTQDAALKRALLADAQAQGRTLGPKDLGRRVRGVLAAREIRATLAALEAVGAEGRYLAVDVTDGPALTTALEGVRAEWGPIRAIVHGAGVLADRHIAEKTDAEFDRVFDTKVDGLRALLTATTDDPLRLLCLFSSVSARCGNNGQSDYAMANEVLNKVARVEVHRRGDVLVKSLGWGPWKGGMVDATLEAHFARLGVPMIPLDVGGGMLADELHGAQPGDVEVVLGGEPKADALLFAGTEGRSLTMDLHLDRTTHPYLGGHEIAGTVVVPVVFALDWLSRLAAAFEPGLEVGAVRALKVLRGIRLRGFDTGGDRLRVSCRRDPESAGTVLDLDLSDASGRPMYRAQVEMVAAGAALDGGRPEVRLDAWDAHPVYDGDVLFHGADFQVIEQMDGISEAGASARLRGLRASGWKPDGWRLDVAALDGALQLALLWGKQVTGGGSLPTSIAEVRMSKAPVPEGPIQCIVVGRESSRSRTLSDIVLLDDAGVRFAELRGVETHLRPA